MRLRSSLLLPGLVLAGCAGTSVRSQSPEAAAEPPSQTRLVGDLAVPYGMHPVKVEEVGLVTQLRGTGSDPPPSAQRSAIVDEMQARGVAYPNHVLSSGNTALVLVRGVLKPGIEQGERFDVEVRIPSHSDTTSLRGGWLMETRLKEMAVIDNQIHDGHVLALAEGPLLVDPYATTERDPVMLGKARVLGGGVALKARPMGLVLKPEKQSISNSALVGTALNRRFHTFSHGVKKGVATPKTNEYIQLDVHPRYKDNVERYVQVVRAVAVRESSAEQAERLKLLERQLLDPVTSATAALRLEGIGAPAKEVLVKGIAASDSEVAFYAAEALAYLDDKRAAEPLGKAAADQPAFRAYALAALGAMDDLAAHDQLEALLHVASAETRYGAFRALWAMDADDPLIRGAKLADQFSLHVVETSGPPLVHVTRSFRPEVVLFGRDLKLSGEIAVEAGNDIVVSSSSQHPDEVTVSRFVVGNQDQKRTVSSRLEDVIRVVAELQGTYPDVVQFLQNAKAKGALAARLEVDAVPGGGRNYLRGQKTDSPGLAEASDRQPVPDNPLPGLFARRSEKWGGESEASAPEPAAQDEPAGSWQRLFARIKRSPSP